MTYSLGETESVSQDRIAAALPSELPLRRWFDTRDGSLVDDVGDGPDNCTVVAVSDLLSEQPFRYANGDFAVPYRRWKHDELLGLGRWALCLLQETVGDGDTIILKQEHIERLYIIGQAPTGAAIASRFGSFWKYREALGQPIGHAHGRYADWSQSDFVNHALQIARDVGKPTRRDYDRHPEGPSASTIWKRVGGVRQLNELIGFPDVHQWDSDDFVDWGVRFMEANDGQLPTERAVDILSKQKRGPSSRTIMDRFAGLTTYQRQVAVAYHKKLAETAQVRQQLQQDIEKLPLEQDLFGDNEPVDETMRIIKMAKLAVSLRCMPEQSLTRHLRVAQASNDRFIAMLRKFEPSLTAGYIESVAVSLQVFDDIWPFDGHLEYLRVA